MKKMGGKKADGLSNVNYNEIQKTILQEVTYYFIYYSNYNLQGKEKNYLILI